MRTKGGSICRWQQWESTLNWYIGSALGLCGMQTDSISKSCWSSNVSSPWSCKLRLTIPAYSIIVCTYIHTYICTCIVYQLPKPPVSLNFCYVNSAQKLRTIDLLLYVAMSLYATISTYLSFEHVYNYALYPAPPCLQTTLCLIMLFQGSSTPVSWT